MNNSLRGGKHSDCINSITRIEKNVMIVTYCYVREPIFKCVCFFMMANVENVKGFVKG